MTREEAIAELLKPHQPLGPFQDPADPDERQETWARSAGPDVLDAMLDLAIHPPGAGQTGRHADQRAWRDLRGGGGVCCLGHAGRRQTL